MATETATTAPPPSEPPSGSPSGRATIEARTLRQDRWWLTPAIYVFGLTVFVVYSTWAVFVGDHFYIGDRTATGGSEHAPYISPFYSPCIAGEACGPVKTPVIGNMFDGLFFLSRLVVLLFPLGFRTTCYYYRKAYYRSYWLSPPACAVAEPHKSYTGERRFPLILQNTHRFWWYAAVLVLFMLSVDAVLAFNWHGEFGMGLGTLVMVANVVLLAGYTFGCHSCRHILGGRLNHFSRHPIRYRLWTWVGKLNERHGFFAWASLISVGLTDLYIRLASHGVFDDPEILLMADYETHELDVLVIGAGGAGLRAAAEAAKTGARTGLVCKSLLGKAHTVMAEGGMAAAMGNVWSEDNWQVHFRDTMRGGKMLNNWRMAQLHAQEAPERVYELEEWGALFDRTEDGRILQRDFGGHRYARLAHIGDRTGLELIRTLQHHVMHRDIQVFMECKVAQLLKDGDRISGALAYWREHGTFVLFKAKSIILATGGAGKIYKFTSNSWEGTGDGHALALWAGADLIDMEFFQLHPTGMIWPLSARGILVTEGVRGDGGVLRNSEGNRFMFDYIPEFFKAETADNIDEADRWYEDHVNNRRPPELLPRDEVARAINAEVKAGRGSPHGGAFLDIATRRSAEDIKRRLPSMYHQFKHLADVDITTDPMEVGPTAHYIMGGIKVDADTQATTVPGLYAAGECSGGMHGANRLGGNSLSDLIVFGKRAGQYAAEYALGLQASPSVDQGAVDRARDEALAPLNREDGENPYTLHRDLQEVMQGLVGIIRVEPEMRRAIDRIEELKDRARGVKAEGHVQYNPGWNEATDLAALLAVAECVTRSAYERKESRGGHTRDDYPTADPQWGEVNNRVRMVTDNWAAGTSHANRVVVDQIPLPEMPDDLKQLFEEGR